MAKHFIVVSLVIGLLMQPYIVFAQYAPGVPPPTAPPINAGPVLPQPPLKARVQCADGTFAFLPPNGTGCPGASSGTAATIINTALPFIPGLVSGTGDNKNFSGLNFSGVGGAVLSCDNVGESIVAGVSNLFKSAAARAQEKKDAAAKKLGLGTGGTGEETPVTDATVSEQLKKQAKREDCLNGVAYAAAKNVLQQMSSKTLNWVNTGFDGNPLYVRDIDSYLKTVKDEKIANYLGTVSTSDPIFGNALRSSITQLVTGYSDGRINEVMNTPEARAYQDFQGDFTKGGWSAFLNPNNNPLGALFKATDSIGTSVNSAQQNVKDELQQGNGFLDMKKCAEYEKPSPTSAINPLGGISSLCANNPTLAYCKTNAAQVSAGAQQKRCLKYETVTPGSVIAAQTTAITTSAIRQAEQADQINEVLGSFFDGLVNRLFSQGLSGLSRSNSAASVSGNNVVIGSNGLPIAAAQTSIGDTFGYERANGGFFGEFDISRPQQLRAVLKTQLNFLSLTKDMQSAMAPIVPTLGELDYCIPGPNPTWPIGTNFNFQLFTSALQGKQPTHTLGNAVSTLYNVAGTAAVASGVGAPIGALISTVGNVVGGFLNKLNDDGGVKSVNTPPKFELFDKVTSGSRQISPYYLKRKDNVELLPFLGRSYDDTVAQYQSKFDPQAITDAFVATNYTSAADAKINVGDMLAETGNLIEYNQAITSYSKDQDQNISQTQDAIASLTTINEQVEAIVATAKARYIKEQATNKTPVNMACINEAYNISKAPITGTVSAEPLTPNPVIQQSNDAAEYFYSHL